MRRFGLAFVVACPFCAGGAILLVGTLLGATVAALKLGLGVAAAVLLTGLWIRNILKRRHEDACTLEECATCR